MSGIRKKPHVCKMVQQQGTLANARREIANDFVALNEQLYATKFSSIDGFVLLGNASLHIPLFTMEELIIAQAAMTRDKACDDLSIVGEMFKDGCVEAWKGALHIFKTLSLLKRHLLMLGSVHRSSFCSRKATLLWPRTTDQFR